MSGEHARWDELRDARLGSLNNVAIPPLLRAAIEQQPPDVGGKYTWVCGCVEYTDNISLCNYHGGYDDALAAVAEEIEEALDMLSNRSYGLAQNAEHTRILLERFLQDCTTKSFGTSNKTGIAVDTEIPVVRTTENPEIEEIRSDGGTG